MRVLGPLLFLLNGACMCPETFQFEANQCRRQAATVFNGRPEQAFLLRLAEMFDELAGEPALVPSHEQ